MARVRSVLLLIALLAAEAGALVGVWRLGGRPWAAIDLIEPMRWLAVTPPGDALAAVLRVAALLAAAYLLSSTAAYVGARCSGVPTAIRAVRWATLPVVRRVADRAVAVALTAGTALGGPAVGIAAAAPAPVTVLAPAQDPPGPLVAPPERAVETTSARAVTTPDLSAWVPGLPRAALHPPREPTAAAQSPGRQASPVPAAETGTAGGDVPAAGVVEVLVAPGDNLWAISAERLAAATNRQRSEVTDREVHGYWVTVLAANRDRLPSRDIDLLNLGDRVLLPPVVG